MTTLVALCVAAGICDSGHSLRRGLATSAAAAGAPERAIMRTTGHRSEAMGSHNIRAGSEFTESSSRYLPGP